MESKKIFREVISTSFKEIGDFSASKYALLGATITGWAFEWGPTNEAVLGAIGVNAHERLGTGGSIESSLVDRFATGAITGAASFTEQAIVGTLTALSLSQFPETFNRWKELRPSQSDKSVSNTSSALTALGLGSSMAVVEKQLFDSKTNKNENVKLALKTSVIVGSANLILAGGVSAGLDILDRNGLDKAADNIADAAKNPLLYIGFFGLAKAIHYYKSKNSNNKK